MSVMDDLVKLSKYTQDGVGGAIVGKALYTGSIDLSEAIRTIK